MTTLLALGLWLHAQTSDAIWIEGENPTSINVKPNIAGWGHKEFLSGEKWLQVSIDADKVDKELPAEGALISYSFRTVAGGSHEIWNRIGYEGVRSQFDWRIDGEDWKPVSPERLTTDMQEFETWNEVAWLKLGDEDLPAGSHNLQIRLSRSRDAKGQTERVLYASDALLIDSDHFHPNGKFPPGSDYRSETDRKAAAKSFDVKDSLGPARQTVSLGGLWEIARDDEQLPGPVDRPLDRLPEDAMWYGIPVPSDKHESRPELTMAHRVWYRTRVVVPAGQIGRSFRLTFPQNNLNTTVWVNGEQCGFNRNPFVNWSCDVTKAIKAGENEIYVGIRDAWYGYSSSPTDPMKLRRAFVLPLAVTGSGFQDLAYPVWHAFESGILATPTLTVGGEVAVSDVFVKPSVSSKELRADVTVLNTTHSAVRGELDVSVVDDQTNTVVKKVEPIPFDIGVDIEQTLPVRQPWVNPILWWPDQPHLYRLRAEIKVSGVSVDRSDTTFGFREWSQNGKDLLLNGIVWHGWAELTQGRDKDEWLANYRKTGQRFMRLSGAAQNGDVQWQGMAFDEALDWFDRNGVIVRRCGPLDGEAIGYWAIENDPDLQKVYGTRIKRQLLDNWRAQMVAQVKGERNHPSIGMWSVENEWLYINCINLYGDLMDEFEQEEKKTIDAVSSIDPTRPVMADGGGSGKGNIFPIHGDHYVYTNDPNRYPELAYQAFPEGGGRGRWNWDGKRPRYLGEEFFATGINPSDYAWIEGEEAFGGKTESEKGMALVQRMLMEGYRWSGEYAAWHLWIGDEGSRYGKYLPNAERAVLCRQQDWSFGSGQTVNRTLGIFNDSHSSEPITLTYRLVVGGKVLKEASSPYSVKPGTNQKLAVTLAMPVVRARTSGSLELVLKVGGKKIFSDTKALSVLPRPNVQSGGAGWLAMYDPGGSGAALLRQLGYRPVVVSSLGQLPAQAKVLVVATDALNEADSAQSALAAYAAEGHRVLVLDQSHPLRYQALPVETESTTDRGAYGFPEIVDHPIFKGLQASDFRGWEGGVYRNAYVKPEKGARSLFQVGTRLSRTAIVEIPVGQGLMLLSQVRVGAGPAGASLLANLIEYAENYRQVRRPVTVAADDDPALIGALGRIGLSFARKSDPLAALEGHGSRIAIESASPANLHALASAVDKVKAFYKDGGDLVLHGLTPEGLADYNRLVGVEHMIRPFRREKVAVRTPRDPLASGLSNSDVVMYSGEKMFGFNDDRFVASDIFSYVVDYDDPAPFAKLADDYLYNTVNGFVSADGWKYIYSFDLNHSKPEYTMAFSEPQELKEITWVGNAFYHKVTKFSLTFDGGRTVTFDVQPNNDAQELPISPPAKGKSVELKILDWTRTPESAEVVGIDNIYLKAARSPEFYATVHPLLNVGGLVRYKIGEGGAVLVNLLFKSQEDVPENAGKKLAILSTILHNLNAPFAGGRTIVPGAKNVQYQTVDISKKANQFTNDRGWFGQPDRTFGDLPTGRQVFAGVPFNVFEFLTSPVPTAIMLGGPGIPGNLPDAVTGIPVGTKAEALFFLQAARIDQARNSDEVRDHKHVEVGEYVIHYSDGQSAVVPIEMGENVDSYLQSHPSPLPGAQIGWQHRFAGSDQSAVAYVQQWNNPRPEAPIESIDLRYGKDRRGVPALLAITAAK